MQTNLDNEQELAMDAMEAHSAREVAVMNIEARLGQTSWLAGALWRLVVICVLCVPFALAQTTATSGRVAGTVFVSDSQGPSYVPGAKVTLSGATSLQQETDAQGHYTFNDVAPGVYTMMAEFPGLEVTQSVTVEAGAEARRSENFGYGDGNRTGS
jgi:hypothetical protein